MKAILLFLLNFVGCLASSGPFFSGTYSLDHSISVHNLNVAIRKNVHYGSMKFRSGGSHSSIKHRYNGYAGSMKSHSGRYFNYGSHRGSQRMYSGMSSHGSYSSSGVISYRGSQNMHSNGVKYGSGKMSILSVKYSSNIERTYPPTSPVKTTTAPHPTNPSPKLFTTVSPTVRPTRNVTNTHYNIIITMSPTVSPTRPINRSTNGTSVIASIISDNNSTENSKLSAILLPIVVIVLVSFVILVYKNIRRPKDVIPKTTELIEPPIKSPLNDLIPNKEIFNINVDQDPPRRL